jgi:hypothetical protein
VELGFRPMLRRQRALRGVLPAARASGIEAGLAPRPAGVCAATAARVGLGRTVAFYDRSSTSYQIG